MQGTLDGVAKPKRYLLHMDVDLNISKGRKQNPIEVWTLLFQP